MIERRVAGEVPPKHHIAFKDPHGQLRFEECLTREGFDGPYTILYHQGRPHTQVPGPVEHGWPTPVVAPSARERPLAKRHYRSDQVSRRGGAPVDARVPLLFNDDVVLSVAFPDAPDPVYLSNGDGDELTFVFAGGGVLRTVLGDLPFAAGDYVGVPRGLIHRWVPTPGMAQHWLIMEASGGMSLPKQWRNAVGQLRMDAPFSHRDFRGPSFVGPHDEGIRRLLVRRGARFHGFELGHSPLDVVGWDGSVWPFAFPILNFQPRVGLVHLPPTWHGTFALGGALVCSFVPRPLDFHPDAVPCPYPHSSVDCDEFIFYCHGQFTSRRGIGPGSVSHHPAGLPHGPHPGAYESSVGKRETDEIAVMLDTFRPLLPTSEALQTEDPGYMSSFVGPAGPRG